jgi:hypothetical protein
MSEKLFQLEQQPETRHDILHIRLPVPRRRSVMPATTRDHLRGAVRETLLAQRSLLDTLIEKTESHQATKETLSQAQ